MNEANMTTPITYVEECEFDAVALTELYNFQRANNPALKGLTSKDIAEMCDMSENTLRELLKGKNKNPRLGTLKRLIRVIGGGSLDRLIGFAPPRDFDKEAETYNATLVEGLQIRLDEKREIITDLKSQLSDADNRLNNLINIIRCDDNVGKEAIGQVKEMEQRLADKRSQIERYERIVDSQTGELKHLRRINAFLTASSVALVAIIVMFCVL